MSRHFYTEGKLGTPYSEDSTLYEEGRRKARRKNPPSNFCNVFGNKWWGYRKGWVDIMDVKDIKCSVAFNNHWHKDDNLYVSFDRPIEIKSDGIFTTYEGWNYAIDGGSIDGVFCAIKGYNPNLDVKQVCRCLIAKIEFLEENYPEQLSQDAHVFKELYKKWLNK